MNNPKISVIVPVYNVEKYLRRCVDSILAQTFTDFELLLIDDGSMDKSGDICDEYAKQDGRVRVFHQKNGGVSKARNVGLDSAKGEWVTFVDSDDWVENKYLFGFEPFDGDIIVSGCKIYGERYEVLRYEECSFIGKRHISTFLSCHLKDEIMRVPWGKLFKKNIILEQRNRFDETLFLGEDTVFVHKYLSGVEKLCTRRGENYNYYYLNSARKYALSDRDVVHILNNLMRVYQELCVVFSIVETSYKNLIISTFMDIIIERYSHSSVFSFRDYKAFSNTVSGLTFSAYPKIDKRIYSLIRYMIIKKKPLISFFLIRFVAPVISNLKKYVRE